MRKTPLLIAAILAALTSGAGAQDRGLTAAPTALGGAFWQARFEQVSAASAINRSVMAPAMRLGLHANLPQTLPQTLPYTLRLLSDYQFSALRLGDTGGLRLTGGVLINLRNPANTAGAAGAAGAADSIGALPYAGIGYSSASLRGDWALSADLGLAAPGLAPARVDRLFGTGAALGPDASARLLPMVRLGMSMAF